MSQFLSPNAVEVSTATKTFPLSSAFTWGDATNPAYSVNAVNPQIVHITNWQGTQKQLEDLVLGAFVELTEKKIYRITGFRLSPLGVANTADLYLNRACTGSGGAFQVVTIGQCGVNNRATITLESGSCVVSSVEGNSFTMTVANQVEHLKPQRENGWLETFLLDTSGGGVAQAVNSN